MSKNAEDRSYEVEFMNCIVDKADDFKIIDCDSHFSEFVGVHISKIHEGKLFLNEIIKPSDRDKVIKMITKKDSRFVYTDFDIIKKNGKLVYVHCTGENYEKSNECRLVLADVSKSREKTKKLKKKAIEMDHLLDLVTGGVCQFIVTPDMHFNVKYLNDSCKELFGAIKDNYDDSIFRIDDLIYKDDKTLVFQAVGKALATGDDIDLECRMKTKCGEFVWFKFNGAIEDCDENKNPIVTAMFSDISRVKEAEKLAAKTSEDLTNLLKNLSGAMLFSPLKKPFTALLISSDFAKFLGYSRTDIFERFKGDISRFVEGDLEEIENKIIEDVTRFGKAEFTYKFKTKEYGIIDVVDKRKLITQEDGKMILISELKKA